MLHSFIHDNRFLLLRLLVMQVCQVFLVNSGSFGKVDYFLSFSSPSTFAHFPNFTKHPSFSSQLSLPSRQHGMIGRHFFLSKLKKKPQNTVNMKNSLQNHSLFYEIYKFPVFSLGPLFRNFITAIPVLIVLVVDPLTLYSYAQRDLPGN